LETLLALGKNELILDLSSSIVPSVVFSIWFRLTRTSSGSYFLSLVQTHARVRGRIARLFLRSAEVYSVCVLRVLFDDLTEVKVI
jgi:hypothetical protein